MSKRDERASLPEKCDCGGRMLYERAHGRIFSACEDCTPVVEVRVPRLRAPVDPPERVSEQEIFQAGFRRGLAEGRPVEHFGGLDLTGRMSEAVEQAYISGYEQGHQDACETGMYNPSERASDHMYTLFGPLP